MSAHHCKRVHAFSCRAQHNSCLDLHRHECMHALSQRQQRVPHLCHTDSDWALVDHLSGLGAVGADGAQVAVVCRAGVLRGVGVCGAAGTCVREAKHRERIDMRGCSSACILTCSSWPELITASLTLFSACMVAVLFCWKESLRRG
jgi:hypothetical protein